MRELLNDTECLKIKEDIKRKVEELNQLLSDAAVKGIHTEIRLVDSTCIAYNKHSKLYIYSIAKLL